MKYLVQIITTVFILFLNQTTVQAQDNYKKQWENVDAFVKKGLTSSAQTETKKIFEQAIADKKYDQQIKAAMYLMSFNNQINEDSEFKNYFYLDSLIQKTQAPAKNILYSMQGELLSNYRDANRYEFYDRTQIQNENTTDFSTWSLDKFNEKIIDLFKKSLESPTLLQKTNIAEFDEILTKGNTRNLRPTLYDLLANRALAEFENEENDITRVAHKFIINDEKYFAPAREFVQLIINSTDNASQYFQALKVYQQLLDFRLKDNNTEALVDADLSRLDFVKEHSVLGNKNELYEKALIALANSLPDNETKAKVQWQLANLYLEIIEDLPQNQQKEKLNQALNILNSIIAAYPNTQTGKAAFNSRMGILSKSLSFQIEETALPNKPILALVNYKNINQVFFRIVPITETTRNELQTNRYNDPSKSISLLLGLNPIKSWSQNLVGGEDLISHSAEIKIDALAEGRYALISSLNSNFKESSNLLSYSTFQVSHISYIKDNNSQIYVLDRDSGKGLNNAVIEFWKSNYDYQKRKYNYSLVTKINTDKNGFAKVPSSLKNDQYFYKIIHSGAEYFSDAEYNYNSQPQKQLSSKKTFFFTDRAIYRPGQTIFFKGILVASDSSGRKNSVIENQKVKIELRNANSEKVNEIELTSNEFGSYSGSFVLPEGTLNGMFYLQDQFTKSTNYFRVEEYKRPKFKTTVDKPSGTYKVNEIITVKGNAKAYAGNNIDGAKVNYRVVRVTRFPIWRSGSYWRIWLPYKRERMEITNGTTTTDAEGNFTIQFKAIPDESIDKKNQPIFSYEVSADVTDINGETRSGNTTVAVAYQALQLNILAKEQLPTDSINKIKVTSTNFNNIFEKATVHFEIFELNTSNKIFRKRLWEAPDTAVMSIEEFHRYFPDDPYMDEDFPSSWTLGKSVYQTNFETTKDGIAQINSPKLNAGWYKIIVTTKDKNGEEVIAEKIIYVLSSDQNSIQQPIAIEYQQKVYQPGQTLKYNIRTGFDEINLIQNIFRTKNRISQKQFVVGNKKPINESLTLDENDRGGLGIGYVFVKNNRVYNNVQMIDIPWSNKDLSISYSTFRDKLLPAAEETWTVNIKGPDKDKIAAEALISMYDASLDQFSNHSWQLLNNIWPRVFINQRWSTNAFDATRSEQLRNINEQYKEIKYLVYDELIQNGWSNSSRFIPPRIVYDQGALVEKEVVTALAYRGKSEMAQANTLEGKAAGVQVEESNSPKPISVDASSIRKDFRETAFFFPQLKTDANGNISFSFTMPEALTTWKMMTLAHDKNLASSYDERTVITQKPLMVQPNAPRFMREGDQMEFSAKIVNLSEKEITGTAQLELLDAATLQPVDGWFNNVIPNQFFTVAAGQSTSLKFPISIPTNYNNALVYRIKAASKDGSFSDGEEMILPVLTNRTLVTETMPINLRQTNSKTVKFDKLINSGKSNTITQHALTVEYTTNPAWYAVQALPYLMEYPYECAEQVFNRFYANVLAENIVRKMPKIKAVFDTWKNIDTAALMSNLQKNQELKSALLEETPWVLEAKNEQQQKKNIAILYDTYRLAKEKKTAINKLNDIQIYNGGFPWFKGGRDNRFITQYILTGIGHLKKLDALTNDDLRALQPLIARALPYLDARILDDYLNLKKNKADLKKNNIGSIQIQYLYLRSFFDEKIESKNNESFNYYLGQAKQYWLSQSKYMQGMIALSLFRNKDAQTPKAIIASLSENAIHHDELGMYWKEFTNGGYWWYQAPIESQSLMIEAYSDITKDEKIVDDLKTWLLKQKQVQDWKTTKATADAVYAILLNGSNWLNVEKNVTIQLGNQTVSNQTMKAEAGTGYIKKIFGADEVKPEMGNISVKIENVANGNNANANAQSTSWGAVYWQYFEDLDKITSAATPLSLVKKLYVEKNSPNGPILVAIKDGDKINVGDKIKVRIELRVDRDMEYIHMKDMRAAAFEPVNVLSQYKWQGGLGYYESTKDASTNFFFDYLPRGTYVFEYPMFVTHEGNFSNGITTIQSMYAPEFSSHSEGLRVQVGE